MMDFMNALHVHADLPLTGITTVQESDIICGRGGLSLKHPGNAAYRKIISLNKEIYATCPKPEKLKISKSIVNAVREINARFLEREVGKTSHSLDETDGVGNPVTWRDIGNKKAIEKTSQALREGQPKLLKKLKEDLDHTGDDFQNETGVNFSVPLNHGGAAPHQFNHAQPLQQGMLGDVQMSGNQPPSQLQRESFTLASLVGTQTMSTASSLPLDFPQFGDTQRLQEGIDSFGGSKYVRTKNNDPNMKKSENWLHNSVQTVGTTDSWGEEDPMPLPYNEVATHNRTVGHVFSHDDHTQLMRCLSIPGDGSGAPDAISAPKRPSVRFRLDEYKQTSNMSLMSNLSEWSMSSALSLDSAVEAAEREAELENIGEFNFSGSGERLTFDMSWGTTNESFGQHGTPKTRRSILKRSNYPMTSNHADPGLIFTSTLDTKPGGVNAGTDVSGILGDNRKSDVKFGNDFCRRRSSRNSMCSALSDFSVLFKRDSGNARSMGSMLSIQSADFRELFQALDSDSDSD